MELEFANENPQSIIETLYPLLEQHFSEASIFGLIGHKFEPDVETYFKSYMLGVMSFYTVRIAGELMGYAAFWIGQHQHCKTVRYAQMDMMFIKKEYRSIGIAKDLVKFAESQLKECGVKYVLAAVPEVNDFSSMLKRDDYKLMDKLYIKGV